MYSDAEYHGRNKSYSFETKNEKSYESSHLRENILRDILYIKAKAVTNIKSRCESSVSGNLYVISRHAYIKKFM